MKQLRLLKNKLRLIYGASLLYWMMFLQVSFLVIYLYAYKITAVSGYFILLKKDLFLWFICIPVMVVQHKVSIFSTYYSCISRVCCKRRMVLVDYMTLAISTCISTCIVLSVPLVFLAIKGAALASQEELSAFFFLLMRYILLGVLMQSIIYSILFAFPDFQKKGGSICVLPFFLYFVFTSPMELLRIKGQYMLFLDFSAGAYSGFAMDGAVLWRDIFFYNIHLVGYLVLYIGITVGCLSKRWEFMENETVCAL